MLKFISKHYKCLWSWIVLLFVCSHPCFLYWWICWIPDNWSETGHEQGLSAPDLKTGIHSFRELVINIFKLYGCLFDRTDLQWLEFCLHISFCHNLNLVFQKYFIIMAPYRLASKQFIRINYILQCSIQYKRDWQWK